MVFSKAFGAFAYLLVAPLVLGAHLHRMDVYRRHDAVVTKQANSTSSLEKRQSESYSSARFTYYIDGLGSCGQTNVASDFIVALDADLYDRGSHCFQTITISYGGKTAQATIMDRCPGCPTGGLDLSEGLFSYFTNGDLGSPPLYGEWWYGTDSGSSTSTTTTSSVWVAPSTTSTSTSTSSASPTSTSTWSSSSSSVATSSSVTSSSSSTATQTSSAAASASSPANVLGLFNQALVGMAGLAVEAHVQ
ncbi:plant expansin [Rhodofomes roseus]|uniref:Plant expansin n=1 Tax=Rhodofomes roseus TaxID=34475 RepID=A0ABQ8KNR5_9APHY|nr:plant expansin [Rhodofomes roseus]KAH9839803.1 plant expansin [Rhodofomes roseus]